MTKQHPEASLGLVEVGISIEVTMCRVRRLVVLLDNPRDMECFKRSRTASFKPLGAT